MRVLVIEDNEYLARTIGRMLKGHEVTVEHDPIRALERFELEEHHVAPFELVICDHSMPGMSGVEVLTRLRTRMNPPLMILSTGLEDLQVEDNVADAMLFKPYRPEDLRATIDRIVRARADAATHRIRRPAG